MGSKGFDFNKFISDSTDTVLKPKEYFESMKTSGGLAEPLIKALIYGVVAGVIKLIWGFLKFGVGSGHFGGAVGIIGLIWAIVGSIIGLFIAAVIILILSAIAKGNTNFEACVRVSASIMVLMPVIAVCNLLEAIISGTLPFFVMLLICIYGFWLLFNGLVITLKADRKTSRIITIVLVVVFVLFILEVSYYFFSKSLRPRLLFSVPLYLLQQQERAPAVEAVHSVQVLLLNPY